MTDEEILKERLSEFTIIEKMLITFCMVDDNLIGEMIDISNRIGDDARDKSVLLNLFREDGAFKDTLDFMIEHSENQVNNRG